MTTQFELPPRLSSIDKINLWADRYTEDQSEKRQRQEKAVIDIKKKYGHVRQTRHQAAFCVKTNCARWDPGNPIFSPVK